MIRPGKMTTQLIVNKIKESSQKIHLVPCEVQHNSFANVDKYFETTIQEDGKGNFGKICIVIRFRGIVVEYKLKLFEKRFI